MMDTPDIEVPDTIPSHITRRHQRGARKTVQRAGRHLSVMGMSAASLRLLLWATVAITIAGLSTGVVMLWMAFPSALTFVVIPSALLMMVFASALLGIRHRHVL